ncbi:hypothetical protein PHLGIDRAFT_429853 [Phlebiopsis gigantea 11061_1 CR5-6]|uniref:Uncharacterized protein n=1 Tax=Phlebiopsis gigantea (strain 11061_1 CR5-6) TaxID=745531 RepID=A0A0C3SAP0_PHLG1|nr:hypothetical protein PHLGIDRAFT_429853 [Phlebiopsis gigantea 11061_1 CR5-6]
MARPARDRARRRPHAPRAGQSACPSALAGARMPSAQAVDAMARCGGRPVASASGRKRRKGRRGRTEMSSAVPGLPLLGDATMTTLDPLRHPLPQMQLHSCEHRDWKFRAMPLPSRCPYDQLSTIRARATHPADLARPPRRRRCDLDKVAPAAARKTGVAYEHTHRYR